MVGLMRVSRRGIAMYGMTKTEIMIFGFPFFAGFVGLIYLISYIIKGSDYKDFAKKLFVCVDLLVSVVFFVLAYFSFQGGSTKDGYVELFFAVYNIVCGIGWLIGVEFWRIWRGW